MFHSICVPPDAAAGRSAFEIVEIDDENFFVI
jgi:hypothetical protein